MRCINGSSSRSCGNRKSRLTIVGVSTKESVGDTEDEGSSEGEREGETLTDGAALGISVCWFVPVSS